MTAVPSAVRSYLPNCMLGYLANALVFLFIQFVVCFEKGKREF